MSFVTYVARREFEPTGYVKIGTDISAAASDDSFNATTTNLSGLLDNQWALVAGFANSANNGWFQANGNSTPTKITQDTSVALVNAAAGPSITINGYKRGLNQSYSLEFGVEKADRSVAVQRSERQPLGGGAPEVLLHRREAFVDVTTSVMAEAALLQWREFLASVEGGEVFTFDRYGTVAVPVEPKSAIIASDSYAEMRRDSMFNYNISFRVRLLT